MCVCVCVCVCVCGKMDNSETYNGFNSNILVNLIYTDILYKIQLSLLTYVFFL